MIETRHSKLTFLTHLVYFVMPGHAALDKHSVSSGLQTGIVTRGPQFVATTGQRASDSAIARPQTWTVLCFIVLLWALFAAALFVVWHRAALG